MPLPLLSPILDRLECIVDLRKDYHAFRDEISTDEHDPTARERIEAHHQKRELFLIKQGGTRTPDDAEETRKAVERSVRNIAQALPHSRAFPMLSGLLDRLEMIVEAREKLHGRRSNGSKRPTEPSSSVRGELLKRVHFVIGAKGGKDGKKKKDEKEAKKKTKEEEKKAKKEGKKKIHKEHGGAAAEYYGDSEEEHVQGNTILSDIPEQTEPPTEPRPRRGAQQHLPPVEREAAAHVEEEDADNAATEANLRDAALAEGSGMPSSSNATAAGAGAGAGAQDQPPPARGGAAARVEEQDPLAAAMETFLQDAARAESGMPLSSSAAAGAGPSGPAATSQHQGTSAAERREHRQEGSTTQEGRGNTTQGRSYVRLRPVAPNSAGGGGSAHGGRNEGSRRASGTHSGRGSGNVSGSSSTTGSGSTCSSSCSSSSAVSDLETHVGHTQGTRRRGEIRQRRREGGERRREVRERGGRESRRREREGGGESRGRGVRGGGGEGASPNIGTGTDAGAGAAAVAATGTTTGNA